MKKKVVGVIMAVIMMACSGLAACNKKDIGGDNGDDDSVIESKTTTIYDMTTEDLVNPVGLDSATPRFSWKMKSDAIGQLQTAYNIVVKDSAAKVVWDSKKVMGGNAVGIVYDGEKLKSSTEYSWKVTVWDKESKEIVSEKATFEMGLLEGELADTKWISFEDTPFSTATSYTINFDFILESGSQGFCFGMQGTDEFVMWQVNAYNNFTGNKNIILRPHFRSGDWRFLPEINISAAMGSGFLSSDIIGEKIHERIEVDGSIIKTYFGLTFSEMTLINTYDLTQLTANLDGSKYGATIPLGKVGFRHDSNQNEVAFYDNFVITNKAGTETFYQDDFNDGLIRFTGSEGITITNKMLKVGLDKSGAGDRIYIQSDGLDNLPAYRKSFISESELVSAKLYTSGLGVYESYINGERVGRKCEDGTIEYHELKPGSNEPDKRKFYNSYDVTWMLKKSGENVLSAVVTNGWWAGYITLYHGKETAYLAKLVLQYADGRVENISTDNSWKSAKASAVLMGDIYNGETYDARADLSWMMPGFDDTSWRNAKINSEFTGTISAWKGSYVTVKKDLQRKVKSTTIYQGATEVTDAQYGKIKVIKASESDNFTLNAGQTALIDFGQNFAGWEAFAVQGERGTTLTIEHGEILNDSKGEKSRGNDSAGGSMYNANYRSAKATTTYILSGDGIESFHPSFTFYGFRYIEITTTDTVTFSSVVGQVVSSVENVTGKMETSNAVINQLISNVLWGQYSNYLSVPTDCPQRDERYGWTADTQVFAETGCFFGYSKSFLEKYMQDMRDTQNADGSFPGAVPTGQVNGYPAGGTGWSDAVVMIPYTLYTMYGDTTVIKENWNAMQMYVDTFLGNTNKKGGLPHYGDWLAYESNDLIIRTMLGVAYYAWDAKLMAEMAAAIGLDDEVIKYESLYKIEKEYFIEEYVNMNGSLKRSEQSVCLHALYLDLLPNENSVAAVTNQLVTNIESKGNRLQTGFLGTKIIMDTLTKIGRSDIAYTLLFQDDNPSWLYSVAQGATTVWERWNSYTIQDGFGDVSMNSFNHYAYGSVAGWMFHNMAGINYDKNKPGFKNIILAPNPDLRMPTVTASYNSAYGQISVKSQYSATSWAYNAVIPANASATIQIPLEQFKAITVNGKALTALTLAKDGVEFVLVDKGIAHFKAVAGSFSFVCAM